MEKQEGEVGRRSRREEKVRKEGGKAGGKSRIWRSRTVKKDREEGVKRGREKQDGEAGRRSRREKPVGVAGGRERWRKQ